MGVCGGGGDGVADWGVSDGGGEEGGGAGGGGRSDGAGGGGGGLELRLGEERVSRVREKVP